MITHPLVACILDACALTVCILIAGVGWDQSRATSRRGALPPGGSLPPGTSCTAMVEAGARRTSQISLGLNRIAIRRQPNASQLSRSSASETSNDQAQTSPTSAICARMVRGSPEEPSARSAKNGRASWVVKRGSSLDQLSVRANRPPPQYCQRSQRCRPSIHPALVARATPSRTCRWRRLRKLPPR